MQVFVFKNEVYIKTLVAWFFFTEKVFTPSKWNSYASLVNAAQECDIWSFIKNISRREIEVAFYGKIKLLLLLGTHQGYSSASKIMLLTDTWLNWNNKVNINI